MSYSTLIPGFNEVSGFGPDEEYEDEEVSYVTLDLGNIEPTLIPTSTSYRLIVGEVFLSYRLLRSMYQGLDTPTPFLQLSGTVFKGQHTSLLGTDLLFTEEKDDADRSRRHVAPAGAAERRIRFQEVQLRPKMDVQETAASTGKGKGKQKGMAGQASPPMETVHAVDLVTGPSPCSAVGSKTKRKGKQRQEAVGNDNLTEPTTGDSDTRDDDDMRMVVD